MTHFSKFFRNNQVTLSDRTPFLRVSRFPTRRLRSEADTLANLQVKEPGLVLNASGLSEGDRKGADFQKAGQPVHRRVKHLNNWG